MLPQFSLPAGQAVRMVLCIFYTKHGRFSKLYEGIYCSPFYFYHAAECMWRVTCIYYSGITEKAVVYEILIQKLQEVDPEANRGSVVSIYYKNVLSEGT
jgi:hypothetical protein